MLHNMMENVVLSLIPNVLAKQEGICKCEICQMDIAAAALNKLPPMYAVTDKGATFSKVNSLLFQFQTDVISAITQATILVSARPRCQSLSK